MLRRFKGGIHPPYNKKPQEGRGIIPISAGQRLVISLSQHIGSPCEPVFKVGDRVKLGQLIADMPEGKLGDYLIVIGSVVFKLFVESAEAVA